MAKISLGGYDDGEGSSNPTQKRRRVQPHPREEEEDNDEEEEEEEEPRGLEIEHPQIETTTEEEEEDNNNNNVVEEDNETVESGTRDRSISVTLTDPDVLDCCICYEPLSAPIFQVN